MNYITNHSTFRNFKAQVIYIYLFHSKYKKNQEEVEQQQETTIQKKKENKQLIIIYKSMFTIIETCRFESKKKYEYCCSILYTLISSIYLTNHHLFFFDASLLRQNIPLR